jgi:hypothetical protein
MDPIALSPWPPLLPFVVGVVILVLWRRRFTLPN